MEVPPPCAASPGACAGSHCRGFPWRRRAQLSPDGTDDDPRAHAQPNGGRPLLAPVLWGVVFGAIQAAAPLGFWWLDPATVYGLSLTLIAAVYIGFAVADGRRTVIAVEAGIAAVFVVVAAAGVTGPAWLLVLGLTGHGVKDLWQHRSHFVANTRWWPPFCLVVDWVAAAILVVLITAGVDFH